MAKIDVPDGLPLVENAAAQGCESVLVVDVGETNTRASYFAVVEGKFRFIACALSTTTLYDPYNHPGYGVRAALEDLERASGQTFIGEDGRIISPRDSKEQGVDGVSVIFSAGPPFRVIAAGLRPDISLESVRRLMDSIYVEMVGEMHLSDGLAWEERGEDLLKARPDIVIIAGGYDGGAEGALSGILRPLDLVCALLAKELQPVVIFAGNQAAQPIVSRALAHVNDLHMVSNVRPGADVEQFAPARAALAQIIHKEWLRRFPGLKLLDGWAQGGLTPAGLAFGRTMRFLSLDDPQRGVLGVDLGTRKAVAAIAYAGEVNVHVLPALEQRDAGMIDNQTLREVMRWLYLALPEEEVRDYLCNRSLYPAGLPGTFKDLAIEQALARSVLHKIASLARHDLMRLSKWSADEQEQAAGLAGLEPIIATGGVLTHAPNLAQTALMLLDGLQPAGITTLILDQNHIAGALGASMKIDPTLAVHVMDSAAFLNLGLVIAPACAVEIGEPVLRLRMLTDAGKDLRVEVKQGELRSLPLAGDQHAQLWLKPLHSADIGLGPGQGGHLGHITGGTLGLIIDCRGRPLVLGRDPDRRRERHKEWLRALRG